MAIFRPDASLQRFLDHLTASGKLASCSLAAFTSNHTPVSTDVAATYTAIEASFGGYARKTVNDWAASTVTSNIAKSVAGNYTWTATGTGLPVTIYGIFTLDGSGGLLYAELIPTGGVTLTAAGHTFTYNPQWTDQNA